MEYKDLFEMVNAILYYVGKYPGRVIVCDDNPMELFLGFTLRDIDPFLLNKPTWRIKLKNYKISLSKEGVSKETRQVIGSYFSTDLGRRQIAELLTKGCKPPELEVTS